jgi:hypothetical protein
MEAVYNTGGRIDGGAGEFGLIYSEWFGRPVPAVDVQLVDPTIGRVVLVRCLIDTGACRSCFPLSVMEDLGIDPATCKEGNHTTIKGRGTVLYVDDRNLIGALMVPDDSGDFWRFPVAPQFAENCPEPLLGREDFLSAFIFTVFHREQGFLLEPYPDTERMARP